MQILGGQCVQGCLASLITRERMTHVPITSPLPLSFSPTRSIKYKKAGNIDLARVQENGCRDASRGGASVSGDGHWGGQRGSKFLNVPCPRSSSPPSNCSSPEGHCPMCPREHVQGCSAVTPRSRQNTIRKQPKCPTMGIGKRGFSR